MTKSRRLLTQFKQRFASEVLWHFVGRGEPDNQQFQRLMSILSSGFKIGKDRAEFKYLNAKTSKFETWYGFPVNCLADIPLKDLHIHAERYGRHAIGFYKESAISHGFQTVLYVNQYSGVFQRFMELRKEIKPYIDTAPKQIVDKLREMFLLLGAVSKSGNLKADPVADIVWDSLQVNNFYYEREWRSLYSWDFIKDDVAVIIMPDEKINTFMEERKKHKLNIHEGIPILPFSMIYAL